MSLEQILFLMLFGSASLFFIAVTAAILVMAKNDWDSNAWRRRDNGR